MKNFKIVQHPTLGTKAVREGGWSWWGFFFYASYFLLCGRLKHFFINVALLIIINFSSLILIFFSNVTTDLYHLRTEQLLGADMETLDAKLFAGEWKDEDFEILDNDPFCKFLDFTGWAVEQVLDHYGPYLYFANIIAWIHGGLLGNKSRYAKLISQGFECVDDFEANNSPHAIALFEKSKQAS